MFKIRGTREPPEDVVIVSIDRESANELNLPDDPRKWPRSLHASLTEKLSAAGAAVIAYDVNFSEPHSYKEDTAFAEAIRKSRNTVLCECMQLDNIPVHYNKGSPPGELSIAKIISPIPTISQYAVALAPFPIPKVSNKVSQYWTFITAGGDKPTFPVATFQIFTMRIYDDFLRLLTMVSPYHAEGLPRYKDAIMNPRDIEKLIRSIRHIFQGQPFAAEQMARALQNSKMQSTDRKKYQMIDALIKMYRRDSYSQYLNFYGPARTITTIPYYKVLKLQENTDQKKQQFDIRNKAVFVGLSQLSPVDQKESFFTVYSQEHGLDISGIEIAATAFANLLEDMPVQPVDFRVYLIIIFLWGLILGFLCKKISMAASFFSIIGLTTLYLIFAVYQFKNRGIWYPIITPLAIQSSIALFGGMLWNYIEVKKERQNIRKAFGFYLPDGVVDQLSKNIEDIHASHQIVYGICLSTDAEQYSSLSEVMGPDELGIFMNRYYETVFGPIKQHGGIISDVVGDSVMAIWVAPHPEASLKTKACFAALDISSALQKFNQVSEKFKLLTRIGLHSGHILLGNIGAFNHYEYRPVGDIVNTAARIEGLNKYLNTQILVTKEVIGQLDGFLMREIGEFKLAGKSKPVEVYELLCRKEESTEQQKRNNEIFAIALDAFRRQSWDEAVERFNECIQNLGEDGPARFYIYLCKNSREHMSGELWDGVIQMEKK